MTNKSTTNACRVFVNVATVDGVYKITPGDGWKLVSGTNGVFVYGGDEADDVASGQTVTFTASAELAVTAEEYEGLTKESLKISMTGMAVNSKASRSAASEALEDYQNGGNEGMIKLLEGTE